jgi:patatin-like phospholipase/acyl hydrolase
MTDDPGGTPDPGEPEPDATLRRFQILSLDGGGLKGLFSAAVLAHLEQDLNVVIADHFDLIVGTSTGGLVALGLGAGLRPAEIVEFYESNGTTIFGKGRGKIRAAFKAKHSADTLRRALVEVFGDRTLGSSTTPLVVPSYSLDTQDVYLFKTPHHKRLRRDWKEKMVDVAMATTAAPTFLPAFRLGDHRLVDGGLWANNPTLVGVVEAVSMFEVPLEEIHILSLGTTDEVTDLGNRVDNGGWLDWARTGVDPLLRAQNLGTFHSAEHLVRPDHILRINTPVPAGLFELDYVDTKRINGRAADVSRRRSDDVDPFAQHQPREYKPLYTIEAPDG